MPVVDVNYLTLVYATVASIVIGAVWYGVFSGPWLKAVGLKKEDATGAAMGYVVSIIASFVTALVLYHMMVYSALFYTELSPVNNGLLSAFWVWLGFFATTSAVTTIWEKKSWNLWLLNNGNWLISLLVMGWIIGAMM